MPGRRSKVATKTPARNRIRAHNQSSILKNSCLCACRALPCSMYAWGNSRVMESLLCLKRAFKEDIQLLQEQLILVRLLWQIKTLPGKMQVELPHVKKLPSLASAMPLCECAKDTLEVLEVAIRATGFFRHCKQSASARQHSSCRLPSCEAIALADACLQLSQRNLA